MFCLETVDTTIFFFLLEIWLIDAMQLEFVFTLMQLSIICVVHLSEKVKHISTIIKRYNSREIDIKLFLKRISFLQVLTPM